MAGALYVGTAGWAIPAPLRGEFPSDGTTLQRYATRLPGAEINSTFHRPHRPATYTRWAESVPEPFRFAVKLPKAITHTKKLLDCESLLADFAGESAGLGSHRGPTLVQLPPSLSFDPAVAGAFFAAAGAHLPGPLACEPRHTSWFTDEADAFLAERRIARVAADPPIGEPLRTGGWSALSYYRLHGNPRPYWSAYEEPWLAQLAQEVAEDLAGGAECWVIFDNTASGAATGNALAFIGLIAAPGA